MRKSAKVSNGEVKTAADLARALGVRHQVVTAHRRKENAPPIANVEQWRVFLAEMSRNGALSPTMATAIAAERLRILKASAETKERENRIKSGEVVETSEVRRIALDINSFFFGELDRQCQTMPSLLKGRTELEIFNAMDADRKKIKSALRSRLESLK